MIINIFRIGILALFLASISNIWSQGQGTLTGRVTNATGNTVPNAVIIITDASSNVSQRALTGSDGVFTITNLPVGSYRIEVESAGFKRSVQNSVQLTTTGPTSVNVTLEVGSTTE